MNLAEAITILEAIHRGTITAIKYNHNKTIIYYQIDFGPEQEVSASKKGLGLAPTSFLLVKEAKMGA